MRGAVNDMVVVGYERTIEQDAAYGFRQLEDIAARPCPRGSTTRSPRPTASGTCDLLVQLAGCRLGPTLYVDKADERAPWCPTATCATTSS